MNKNGLFKLQQIAQLEEQYKNDDIRNESPTFSIAFFLLITQF